MDYPTIKTRVEQVGGQHWVRILADETTISDFAVFYDGMQASVYARGVQAGLFMSQRIQAKYEGHGFQVARTVQMTVINEEPVGDG